MMRRPLDRLAEESYDLLIIGGGVNGLASAWDAALRGLKVALIEKGDYGAATSAASLKIIHGGLRYLQHLDFGRMREGISERHAMMRLFPYLIEPFPFLVPTYGFSMKGKAAMRAAFMVNDFMSRNRNRDLPAAAGEIPGGKILSKSETLGLAPSIETQGLTGGAMFYDARMHNSERVTLAFALAADELGTDLANYVCAKRLVVEGEQVVAVEAEDQLTGASFSIRAKQVLNACGPWNPLLLEMLGAKRGDFTHSAGVQVITRAVTTQPIGLAVTSQHEDPDSKLKRGGRHYFTTAWRGNTIWGTTDRVYQGDPDQFRITREEVIRFVEECDSALPGESLRESDILHAYGGLRPVEGKNLHTGSQVSRRYTIFDHGGDLKVNNLLSIQGIKYTACRLMAEKAVDAVVAKLGGDQVCRTNSASLSDPLVERDDLEKRLRQLGSSDALCLHLIRTWGADAPEVIAGANSDDLTPLFPTSAVCSAEVRYVVRNESVHHLSDVLFGRTELGTMGYPGAVQLDAVAQLVGDELNWDEARKRQEVEAVQARYVFKN